MTKGDTQALRHSKVKLTWDQDDPGRSRLTRVDFTKLGKGEVDNLDFSTYLASASDSSAAEEEEEQSEETVKRDAMRQMLGLDDKPKKAKKKAAQGDMEITFMPAFEQTEQVVAHEDENALQTYKRKEKERKQRKKETKAVEQEEKEEASVDQEQQNAELELLMSEDEEDLSLPGRHFDMKAILKHEKLSRSSKRKHNKAKAKKLAAEVGTDAFQLDTADSRFGAVLSDPHFAIDPSNPHFRKSKNMDKLLEETRSKRATDLPATTTNVKETTDLEKLVQSVKRKSAGVADGEKKRRKKRECSNLICSNQA